MSNVIQGFAFGTGSSIARQAVGSIMGGGSSEQQHPDQQQLPAQAPANYGQAPAGACAIDNEALMNCLKQNTGDATSCQIYFNALQSCQANQGM
jgi:hypothetical protein